MITRHHLACILLCMAMVSAPVRSQEEFVNCTTADGTATRCEPESETFSLNKIPVVNSTCGSPPNDYCVVETYSISELGEITVDSVRCELVCDATDEDNSHPPQEMTDFFSPYEVQDTWWQSETAIDSAADTVVIDLALGTLVQVSTIIFRFRSLVPDGFYILKSQDFTTPKELLHYHAADCESKYELSSEVDLGLENETTVLCQAYDSQSPDRINFVPTLSRPSDRDETPGYSNALYKFATATNIRVVLDGHLTGIVNDSFSYYALRDLSVVGKCQCWGHARSCSREEGGDKFACECEHNTAGTNCERCLDLYNDIPWPIANGGDGPNECKVCECNGRASACMFDQDLFEKSGNVSGGMCIGCTGNTAGPHCDECAEFFYHNSSVPNTSSDFCQSCDCELAGVTNDGVCVGSGDDAGQCYCKANVTGQKCDMCKPGHYNLQASNQDGCTACSCNSSLTLSNMCDPISGACICKNNAIGDDCSTCDSAYFLSANLSVCVPCGCDVGGSLSDICDLATGQCVCRDGVVGRTCSEPAPGYYFPFIDHLFLREAEESLGLFNISYQKPPGMMDPKTFTGAGFASISDKVALIHIGEFVPLVSGTYEFVIRYNLASTWSQLEMRIDVGNEDGGGPPTACAEYDGSSQLFYNNLTAGMAQAISIQLCLRAGRSYSLNLNGFMRGSSTDPLLVDSMVVFLNESVAMTTLSLPVTNTIYHSCVNLHKSLATQTDQTFADCESTAFSVFTEYYNSTLPCECDPIGTVPGGQCAPYGGQCPCRMHVTGRRCDGCEVGTYGLQLPSILGCIDCNCFANGSVNEFCNQLTGQCSCEPNVSGRDCSSCSDGFFSTMSSLDCLACGCNVNGSMDQNCDKATGECSCMQNVVGKKCTQCQPNHFGFPDCQNCGCNPAGSSGLQCDDSGQCSCKSNAEGSKCSDCVDRTFNMQVQNPDGCQPCFCSGLPVSCLSSSGYVSADVFTDFLSVGHGWTSSNPGVDISLGIIVTNTSVYLSAPNEFLGNKLSSYGQFLLANVSIMGTPLFPSTHDVLLEGNGVLLGANFSLVGTGPQILTVHFHESQGWLVVGTDKLVGAADLQSVLFDLTSLQVHVSYGSQVQLISISLESTEAGNNGEAGWVEQCQCPPTHTGLSCEQCAPGHFRKENGSCVPCQCNGFSTTCNATSGICIDCLNNTAGDSCHVCATGFYGNPLSGSGCEPCACPLSSTPGQFSNSCMEVNGNVICTDCPHGHSGDQCEGCASGFFGDPTGMESGMVTGCSNCSCSNNVDLSDPDSCNKTTGVCQKCLFNTTGISCERCLDNYFGDPLEAKNCFDCECDPVGSASLQCDHVGLCSCRVGVSGDKCGECEPNHYNLTTSGCQPCDCDPEGSSHTLCDPVTGQCPCRPGVDGRRCDMCMLGYYGLDNSGCKGCGCHQQGSVSPQCLGNGSCICKDGVMGINCSQCQENYFLLNNGTCSACSDCYWQLKDDVDSTRDHLKSTIANVNSVAEKNDPSTPTFHSKITTAQLLVSEVNASASELATEYLMLDKKLALLEQQVCDLDMSKVPNIMSLLEEVQKATSPVIGLVTSSELIMNGISKELNDSIDVLLMINSILPTFEDLANLILAHEQDGRIAAAQLGSHAGLLQTDLEMIANITNMAVAAANQSLDVAAQTLSLFTSNLAALGHLKTNASNLTKLVNMLQSNLYMLKLDIMDSEYELDMLSTPNLPLPPDGSYLAWLTSTVNQTLTNVSRDLAEIRDAENTLSNLTHLLQSLYHSFNTTQAELQSLLYQIAQFSSELLTKESITVNVTAQAWMCISRAEYILSALQNFSQELALMQAEADRALISVTMIKHFAASANTTVQHIIGELQNANNSLNQGLPLSVDANTYADKILEIISELDSNLTATLGDIDSQLASSQTGLATLQAQQVSANHSLNQLLSTEPAVNQAMLDVMSQATLPKEAALISTNASALVSQLISNLSLTPEPDFSAIDDLLAYLSSVSDQLSMADLETTQTVLNLQLQLLNQDLITLKSRLSTAKEELEDLQQLSSALPPDCDSNY